MKKLSPFEEKPTIIAFSVLAAASWAMVLSLFISAVSTPPAYDSRSLLGVAGEAASQAVSASGKNKKSETPADSAPAQTATPAQPSPGSGTPATPATPAESSSESSSGVGGGSGSGGASAVQPATPAEPASPSTSATPATAASPAAASQEAGQPSASDISTSPAQIPPITAATAAEITNLSNQISQLKSQITEISRTLPPKIEYLSPSSGPVGSTIEVSGYGFSAEANKIFIRGKVVIENVASSDGTTLKFTLSSDTGCGVGEACPIKVITQTGITNAVPFKITAGTIIPPPPEPTATTTPAVPHPCENPNRPPTFITYSAECQEHSLALIRRASGELVVAFIAHLSVSEAGGVFVATSSDDGRSWSVPRLTNVRSVWGRLDLTEDANGMLVLFVAPDLYTFASKDGLTWIKLGQVTSAYNSIAGSIISAKDGYYYASYGQREETFPGYYHPFLTRSKDLLTWETPISFGDARSAPALLQKSDGLLYAFYQGATFNARVTATSTNGVTWNKTPLSYSTAFMGIRHLLELDNKVVLFGPGGDAYENISGTDLYYSFLTDGIWSLPKEIFSNTPADAEVAALSDGSTATAYIYSANYPFTPYGQGDIRFVNIGKLSISSVVAPAPAPLTCPTTPDFQWVGSFETGWDPAKWSLANTSASVAQLIKTKNGVLFAGGIKPIKDSSGNTTAIVPMVYRSYDNGKTWGGVQLSSIATDPNRRTIDVWTVAEDQNGILYAGGTFSTLWKSTDGGATWVTLPKPASSLGAWPSSPDLITVNNLLVRRDNTLIATLGTAIYNSPAEIHQSIDGGASWQKIATTSRWIASMVEAQDGALVFMDSQDADKDATLGYRAIWRFANGTLTKTFSILSYWAYIGNERETIAKAKDGTLFAVSKIPEDPYRSGTVERGSTHLVAYLSTDNGITWSRAGTLPYSFENGRVLGGASDGSLYAIAYSSCQGDTLYRSTDLGATWTPLADGPTGYLWGGFVNELQPSVEISGVALSVSRGAVFSNGPVPTPPPLPSITVASPNGGELFVVYEVVKISWSTTNLASKIVSVRLLKDGVYHSTLGGNVPQNSESGTFIFGWLVPASIQDQFGFTIEIVDATNPATRDVSDGPFRVSYPHPAAGLSETWPPGMFERQITFNFATSSYPGTTTLKIYEKRPGASSFSPIVTFPITSVSAMGCNNGMTTVDSWTLFFGCGRSDPLGPYDAWFAWNTKEQPSSAYPSGTYEYYIAAVDSIGNETTIPPSGIARAPLRILRNIVTTPINIVSPSGAASSTPTFTWTLTTGLPIVPGYRVAAFDEKIGDMQRPYWQKHIYGYVGSQLYDGPPLDPAKRYYAFVSTGYNAPNQNNFGFDVYNALPVSAPLFWTGSEAAISSTPPPASIRAGWGITRDNTNKSSLYFHAINFTVAEPYPSALRVYLKKPGESVFTRAAEFTAAQFSEAAPCSKIVTSGSASYTSWWTMFRFCNSNSWKIDSYLLPATGYPQGEYQFYLASVDAGGNESASPKFGMYNLAPLTILAPTSAQSPVGSKPTFQWTVASGWPTSPAPYTLYIYDEANFAMSKEVHIATVNVPTASTTGTYLYDGPALDPAKKYRVLMTGLKRAALTTTCPSCDYISMDLAPQTFWVSSPTVAAVPIAPTRMRADLQSSNPPGSSTKLVPRIIFNYSTTTVSQYAVSSFRLYAKLPGETSFTRVAEFTDLPLTRTSADSVRTSFGSWKLIPTSGGADWLGFKVNALGEWDYQLTTSYPIGPHSYYVTAANALGESPASEVATEHWLGPITVLAPRQDETVATTTPTFKWTIASGWPFTPPHTVYLIDESKWGSGLATWAKQKWSWDGSLTYDGPALDTSKRYMAFVSGRAYMNDTTSYFSHAAATVTFSLATTTTTQTTATPPPPPTVSLKSSSLTVDAGQPLTFTVSGHSDIGLAAIWWFGTSTGVTDANVVSSYPATPTSSSWFTTPVINPTTLDRAFGSPLFSAEQAVKDYTFSSTVTISKPGLYSLGANSRDILYPVAGEPHQASEGAGIAIVTVTVVGTATSTAAETSTTSTISVLSPNGGEKFIKGEKTNISWSTNGLASKAVRINLLKGGALYSTITSNYPQNSDTGSFSYAWVVPAGPPSGTDYTIQIVDAANSATSDTSDGTFGMAQTQSAAHWGGGSSFGQDIYYQAIRFHYPTTSLPQTKEFRFYQKRPGETNFSLAATFGLPAEALCGRTIASSVSWNLWYSCVSGSTAWWFPEFWSVSMRQTFTGAQFPVGDYEFYLTAVDSAGKETIILPTGLDKGSQFLRLQALEPVKILSPVGLQTTATPTIEWTVAQSGWPSGFIPSYYVRIYQEGSNLPYYQTFVRPVAGATTASKVYDGPALDPTKKYSVHVYAGLLTFDAETLHYTMYASLNAKAEVFWMNSAPPAPTGGSEAGGYFGANNEGFYSLGLRFYYATSSLSQVQAFRLYQKAPADSSFSLAGTFDNPAPLISSCGGIYTATWELQYSCGGRFWLAASRPGQRGSYFAVGEYSYYVTAVNSTGVESAPSPVFKEYVLRPTKILSPTSTQSPVAAKPTISWTVTSGWPSGVTPKYQIVIYDAQTKGQSPIYVKSVAVSPSLSQYSYVYDGPALDPTKRYAIIIDAGHVTWETSPRVSYISMVENIETFWVSPPPPPPPASAAEGQLKWVFTTATEYNPPGAGDASIGSDGTIYVGNYTELVAINPDGTKKWAALRGTGPLSPSVGNDGTLFTPTGSLTSYALNPDGSTKWIYPLSAYGLYGRPAIASDGTIYVTDGAPQKKLYALSSTGSLKWTFATTTGVVSLPAIASDGTVYVGAAYTATHQGSYGAVYALNPDGSIKWIFNIPKINYFLSISGFAIDNDGTIYFGSSEGRLFALNPDGTQKWMYRMSDITVGLGAPSIASDGTLYVPVSPSSFSTKLIALNPDGIKKWTFTLPTGQYDLTTPTIGADGTLYAVSSSYGLYAINPDGTIKWTWSGTDTWGYNTPSLAPDGTIYIGSAASGKVYAVQGVSLGLANSPWPRSMKNNRFTGSISDTLTEYTPPSKSNVIAAVSPSLLATMLAALDALLKTLQQIR